MMGEPERNGVARTTIKLQLVVERVYPRRGRKRDGTRKAFYEGAIL